MGTLHNYITILSMPIFNSLGSNYNFSFAVKALLSRGNLKYSDELTKFLESKYGGKATLLYKAREAIFLALKTINLPKNSVVAINGYTCYAVYKAIVDAGYKPEYLDIPKGDLNFSVEAFKLALEKNPAIKVLIIQNTLGYPCDMAAIESVCKEHSIILIEDLAHSIGAVYKDGREAGRLGDFTVLSFSQDKMIDAVSGGALIIRNKKYQTVPIGAQEEVSRKQQIMDRCYPQLTYKIRNAYALGLGKITHKFYKSLGWLSKPMGESDEIILHKLPARYCGLVLYQFQNLGSNLKHRKEIAEIYAANLNSQLLFKNPAPQISGSTNLRFPIMVEDRNSLISNLKNSGVYVSDIWYDAPVAPEKYMAMTNYNHNCPEAETIAKKMLNLPTHININAAQAKKLAEKINSWLESR